MTFYYHFIAILFHSFTTLSDTWSIINDWNGDDVSHDLVSREIIGK